MSTLQCFFKDWKKVLAAIFLLGALLRFYHLGETSLTADEFLDMNAAYGYFRTGEWQAWDFNFERPDTAVNANSARDERAFAYKWQVAQLFEHFPPTESVARSVSALWGLVTLLLIFQMTVFFTKRKDIGLVAAFLYAVSISALLIDRRLRMYAMFVPVFMIFVWAVYGVLEIEYRGKIRWLRRMWQSMGLNGIYIVPALLFGALSLHLHLLTVNIACIVFLYALANIYSDGKKNGWQWNKYNSIIIAFFLGIIGLKFFVPNVFHLLAASFSFPDNHYGYITIILKDYTHPLLASAILFFGLFAVLGKNIYGKAGLWVASIFVTILFMAVFMWDRNVGEQYIAFVQPFKIMAMAMGLVYVGDFFAHHLKGFEKKAFVGTLFLGVVMLPAWGYFMLNDNMYHQTSQAENPQYRKVFGYFMKHYSANDVLITRDLRSYYISGAHISIENIGGEITKDKLSLDRLNEILLNNNSGWIILSDNDDTFVSKEAMLFIVKNMERVSDPAVRGQVNVYRWGSVTP